MELHFQLADQLITLTVEPQGDAWRVRLPDGAEHHITARRLAGDVVQIAEGRRTFRVPFARNERGVEFSLGGQVFAFAPPTAPPPRGSPRGASGALRAPMAGVVADVLVEEGQSVQAYQPLAVIEAMKVFATVEAPFAGTVRKVYVHKHGRVEQGVPVVDITPVPEGG